jgi:NADH-quinone oxidoreductase subunit A
VRKRRDHPIGIWGTFVLADYLPILMLLGLSTLFAVASVYVASKMGPSNPSTAKASPYECGITPERLPNERFPVKFYLIAMLFIIFDVEIVFFYPWAVIFRELRLFGLAEMGVFVGLLLVAYVYIWKRGGLDWEEGRTVDTLLRRRIMRERLLGPGERGVGAPESSLERVPMEREKVGT